MSTPSIAELRAREVRKLAAMHNEAYTENDLAIARRLMTSFYRLCGLAETNLYLQNDARRHDTPYAIAMEEKEDRWRKRLSDQFRDFAGLELFYCGYLPSIGIVHRPSGGCSEKITRWFYR